MSAGRREADGTACGMEGGLGKGWDGGGSGRMSVPCGGADSALWFLSSSPAWWSSRRLLACQLKTGTQTSLKLLPGPGAAIFFLVSFPLFLSGRPHPKPSALFRDQRLFFPIFPFDVLEVVVMSCLLCAVVTRKFGSKEFPPPPPIRRSCGHVTRPQLLCSPSTSPQGAPIWRCSTSAAACVKCEELNQRGLSGRRRRSKVAPLAAFTEAIN